MTFRIKKFTKRNVSRYLKAGLMTFALVYLITPMHQAMARPGSVYTLAKVKLDVRADNAVLAKSDALKTGPLQALRLMFKRLAPFRAYDRLSTLTLADADGVIDGFAVRSERNSSTRYLALLDYNFSRLKLQALLTKKGVPFFDGRSRKQVLMPVFVTRQEQPIDAEQKRNKRNWWRAWRTIDLKHALTDTRLYKAKNSDHNAWQKIAAGEVDQYNLMRKAYATPKLILVEARLNEQKDVLTLRLFGEDAIGRIDYSQEMPITNGLKESYETAARIAFAIIEGRWREPQIAGDVVAVSLDEGDQDAGVIGQRLVDETIFLRVTFRGLRDWQRIRKKLQRIPGVQKMQVNSLSPRGADVRLKYPGGADRLRRQLTSYGLALDQRGDDLILRSTSR